MPATDGRLLLEVRERVDAHGFVGARGCEDGEMRVWGAEPGAGVAGRGEAREGLELLLRRHRGGRDVCDGGEGVGCRWDGW